VKKPSVEKGKKDLLGNLCGGKPVKLQRFFRKAHNKIEQKPNPARCGKGETLEGSALGRGQMKLEGQKKSIILPQQDREFTILGTNLSGSEMRGGSWSTRELREEGTVKCAAEAALSVQKEAGLFLARHGQRSVRRFHVRGVRKSSREKLRRTGPDVGSSCQERDPGL